MDELGLGSEESGNGKKPGSGPKQPSSTKPAVIDNAKDEPSIKAKFGIQSEETDGVSDTFNTLSAYIQAGGLDDDVIQLGDWIDLEGGLTVEAYNGHGAINNLQNTDVIPSLLPFEGYEGKTLRLIVVGINSFQTRGSYVPPADSDHDATPHVVFQFQNIPVKRRMNSTSSSAGGYAASEMRKYLVDVAEDGDSGKFLEGLKNAGVPETALWAPKRLVSVSGGDTSPGEISDLLWLPTEREMFGGNPYSVEVDETAENQARLEYYTDNTSRIKFAADPESESGWKKSGYYEASYRSTDAFCIVGFNGGASHNTASDALGCVPAFCVR